MESKWLKFLFDYLYRLLVYAISFYRFLKLTLPTKIVTKGKQIYVENIAFDEYCIKYKEKYHKLYVLNTLNLDITSIKKVFEKKSITHACVCIFDQNGEMIEYVLEITDQLNYFRFHFEGNEKILWKHIISFLSKVSTEHTLYVNIEGSESKFVVKEILNKPFLI